MKKRIMIRRPNGLKNLRVKIYAQFKMFGHEFGVTESRENEGMYTVTNIKSGFCIGAVSEPTYDKAIDKAIKFMTKKGKKKVDTAVYKSHRLIRQMRVSRRRDIRDFIKKVLFYFWIGSVTAVTLAWISLELFCLLSGASYEITFIPAS